MILFYYKPIKDDISVLQIINFVDILNNFK